MFLFALCKGNNLKEILEGIPKSQAGLRVGTNKSKPNPGR